MVWSDWYLLAENGVHQEWRRSQLILLESRRWAAYSCSLCGWPVFDRVIQAHQTLQGESSNRIRHEGPGADALFLWFRSMAAGRGNLPRTRKIHNRNSERFQMEDCRPMATPMITNWKKIDTSEDDEADPTLYRQLLGSLMYLVNTRPDICYAVNTLSQFMVEPRRAH